MAKHEEKTSEETEMQKVYILGRITYLPHYTRRGVFVAPGHTKDAPREYGEASLIAAGAKVTTHPLWRRGALNG